MFDRRRHFVSLLRLLILAVWCAAACMAQAPVGSLMGTAHDSTGAIMPGVTVTVTNKDTGLTRHMTTSAEGIFSAASLPAGNYTVNAAATGFRTLEVSATVQTGQVTNVDLECRWAPKPRSSTCKAKPHRSTTTATRSPALSRTRTSRTCR